MTTKKIALFIDADNISAKFGKQIIEALEGRGEIFIRRIYGNWEKALLHGWNDCILNYSLRPMQQIDFAAGKNATDMSLTIDAMDVLYGGKAEVFALVSNDSDFTPLAIRLREGCVNVIGLGTAQVSNSFRSACSEFIMLDAPAESQITQSAASVKILKPPTKVTEKSSSAQMSLFEDNVQPPSAPLSPKVVSITDSKLQSESDKKLQQLHNILHESARTHGDDAGFSLLNYAGQAIKSKNLGFGVKDFGYAQLRDFIAAFPKLYETRQDAVGKSFRYRCRADKQKVLSDKLLQIHAILREIAKTYGDADGFAPMCWAGQALREQNLSVKKFYYSSLNNFVAAFPNLYEMIRRSNGENYCYRCLSEQVTMGGDKLQQIHHILRETAEAHRDQTGFATLSWAGDAIGKKNLSIKGFGHSTLSKFIAAFPKLYEIKGSGTTISYRCL